MANNNKSKKQLLDEISSLRKKIEELKESEVRYRKLSETILEAIAIHDKGKIIECNKAFADIFEYSIDELIGMNVLNLAAPDSKEKVLEHVKSGCEEPYHAKGLTKSGREFPGILSGVQVPYRGKIVRMVTIRDITQEKKAEKALIESEKRFRQVVDNARELIWEVDTEGLYTYVSPVIEKITGFKPEEVVGKKHFYDLFHPDDREELKKTAFEVFEKKEAFREFPNRNIDKEGNVVWLLTSGIPILDEDGELLGYRGVDSDITERKLAQDSLAMEKDRLSVTLSSIGDAVIATDTEGRITLMNRIAETLTGYTQAESLARPLEEVFCIHNEVTGEECEDPVRKVIETGQIVGLANHTVLIARDGTKRVIADSGAPIRDSQGGLIGVVLVFRDITEKYRSSENIRKLNEIATEFVMLQPEDDIYSFIGEKLNYLFPRTIISINEFDDESNTLIPRYLGGLNEEESREMQEMLGANPAEIKFPNIPDDVINRLSIVEPVKLKGSLTEAFLGQVPPNIAKKLESYLGIKEVYSIGLLRDDRLFGNVTFLLKSQSRLDIDLVKTFINQATIILQRKDTLTQLRRSERKLSSLFTSMHEMVALHEIVYKDGEPVDYVILDVNPSYEETTGISREQAIGKRASELYGTEEAPYINKYVKVVETGEPIDFETYFTPMQKFFSVSAVRLGDKRFATVSSDITETKLSTVALENEKERLSVTLRSIGDAVIATDTNGLITLINKVAEELTGWSSDYALGKPLDEIFNIVNEKTGNPCENPVEKVLESGRIIGLANHTVLISCDDVQIPIEDSGAPIRSREGDIIGVVLVFRDIREKKRAQKALRAKAKYQEQLLQTARYLSSTLEPDVVLNRLAEKALDILGSSGCAIYRLDEEDRKLIPLISIEPGLEDKVMNTVLGIDNSFTGQAVKQRKGLIFNNAGEENGGQWIPGTPKEEDEHVICAPFIVDKKVTGAICLSRYPDEFDQDDLYVAETLAAYAAVALKNAENHNKLIHEIEERIRTERALKESEKRYRTLFKSANDGIFLIKDYHVIDCNEQAEVLYQRSRVEIIGKMPHELSPKNQPEDGNSYKESIKKMDLALKEGPQYFEWVHDHPDGSTFIAEIGLNKIVLENEEYILALIRDITERKEMERELRKSEERNRMLVERAPLGIFLSDIRGNLKVVNQALVKMLGSPSKEATMRINLLTFPLLVETGISRKIEECIAANKSTVNDFFYKSKWDKAVYATLYLDPVHDSQGGVVGVQGLIENITERKKAEMELASEKERLAVTLRSIGDGVITTDIDGRITLVNKVAEKLTGWKQEKAIGKPIEEIFKIENEITGEPCENPVDKALKTGQVVELANHTKLISRDGTERIIADSGAPILDKDSNIVGVVLVFRDITRAKELEEELTRAQKLESVGQLAGGIAHDFNNILTAIIGNISIAREKSGPNSEQFELLLDAEKASLQAKNLTQQLLTFSRGGAPIRTVCSLRGLLMDTCNLALRGSSSTCSFNISEQLRNVEVDEGQISQVIHNLVINADQAMKDGGSIEVYAENAVIKEDSPLPLKAGEYVVISVIDEGKGIPREDLAKVFDPYFTTKENGTGLGLAVCYSIIKNHDGLITVDSDIGERTTFKVYLPSSIKDISPEKIEEVESGDFDARVILMDDERIVRRAAKAMLKHLGCDVTLVENGQELLEKFRQAKEADEPFDLVIMDLTIRGGMGGREAIEKLKEIDPEVIAIVSSGYSTDPIMANYRRYGFSGVLTKPYKISEIQLTLKEYFEEK